MAAVVAWIVGHGLHDAPWPLDLLSYVPAAPLAPALLLLAALSRGRRRAAAAVAAAAVVAYVVTVDVRRGPELAAAGDDRLTAVQWNVAHGFVGWRAALERLRRLDADLYVLNELPRHVVRGETALRLGPGYTYIFGDLTGIACRGELGDTSFEAADGLALLHGRCRRLDGRTLDVLAVDVAASPLVPRRPLIERLHAEMAARRPDLVAGDFNTPARAGLLRTPPAGFVNTEHTAGRGWTATWPVPFPVLALDQILLGERLEAIRLEETSTASSDHRLLKLTLRFRPEFSAAAPRP
ncbi:MAG: endonuclease/exonuclease/phosphatase family protein [Acidobacteriota bacterium]